MIDPAAPNPDTPALRKARQFARLQRLGDLAMAVAEAAAQSTIQAYAEPDPQPDAIAKPVRPIPAAEHALTFARAARIVREITNLEIRLDQPARATLYRPHDPRRAPLREVLHGAVAHEPDAPQRRREINDRIEMALAADPSADRPLHQILSRLCDDLDIEIELADVPDIILGIVKPAPRQNL